MDTDSFIVHVKTDDIYKDIAEDVETKFEMLNFEKDRPLPKGKTKQVIGLINDELGGQIMKELKAVKTYSCLKDNNDEDKKANATKKFVIKRKLKFQDNKNCLEAAQIENKINYLEKNEIDANNLKEFVNKKVILKTQ